MKRERSDVQRLLDIVDAIEAIERHPAATREEFDANELLMYFALKHVEIIGEAVFKISKELKEARPEIPWKRIETSRHVIVHDYWRVDWDIVWQVVTVHLPSLKAQVRQILEELDAH